MRERGRVGSAPRARATGPPLGARLLLGLPGVVGELWAAASRSSLGLLGAARPPTASALSWPPEAGLQDTSSRRPAAGARPRDDAEERVPRKSAAQRFRAEPLVGKGQEGGREPERQGAREPGSQRAREPASQGAREPGSNRAGSLASQRGSSLDHGATGGGPGASWAAGPGWRPADISPAGAKPSVGDSPQQGAPSTKPQVPRFLKACGPIDRSAARHDAPCPRVPGALSTKHL